MNLKEKEKAKALKNQLNIIEQLLKKLIVKENHHHGQV